MNSTIHPNELRELLGKVFEALPESRKAEFKESIERATQGTCLCCAHAHEEQFDPNVSWYKRPVPQSMRQRIAAVCAATDDGIVAAANEFMDWYDAISLVRCNGVPVRG